MNCIIYNNLLRYMNELIQSLAYLRILGILSSFAWWEKKIGNFLRVFLRCTKNEESQRSDMFNIPEGFRCACFPKISSTISFFIFAEFRWKRKKNLCFLYIETCLYYSESHFFLQGHTLKIRL